MDKNHNHEQLKKECILYFKQNAIWKQLFTGFRNKYESYGRFSGKVIIKNLSFQDIEELEGFFGQNYHGKKSATISAEKFEKALSKSKYADIKPQEILEAYFGNQLIAKAEVESLKEQKKREVELEFADTFKDTPAESMLDAFKTILKTSTKSNIRDNCETEINYWKRLLWCCAEIYNSLPYRTGDKTYLAVFAAQMTGNPHAFDYGTTEGNILYQVIQVDLEMRHISVETSDIFSAYKRQKSYLLAGIMIDDISNYALLYNVHAIKKDGSLHKGIEGFYEEKNIVQVPLNVIAEWEKIECINNEIFVVENPSVFAMICKDKSCMCMNGQPRLAALMVIELLAKSETTIYYSGDLDPEGLLIAQKLSRFYGGIFIYWHMTVDDYEECKSNEILSEKRLKMLENITDVQLMDVMDAIRKCGRAGYQENIKYNALAVRNYEGTEMV